MERAIAVRDSLARDHPEVPRHRRILGSDLKALGYTFALQRKFPQAEDALKRSVTILEQLATEHPLDIQVAAGLADTYANMMDALLLQGDLRSALEWAGRAIPQKRTVARRDPGNLNVNRTELATTIAARAEILMRLGRHAEALTDFEEILDLTRRTKDGDLYQAFRGVTKARLGDLSALQLLGDQVRETVKVGAGNEGPPAFNYWMTYYDGACIHAALSKLALEQRGRPASERERLARSDLERAMQLLDKARKAAEFRMIRPDEVRREKLLDPLRSRPDFRLLMMDVAFPAEPFAVAR
jgi:tetratricopeptide (TPR) repeat protein